MNIFVLSLDPDSAAKMQCDQHVVKMPLETAQLLCSAYEEGKAPYKRTHYNHPCSAWVRESSANYSWLVLHGLALCDEYEHRYQKIHASKEVIYWCFAHMDELYFPSDRPTKRPAVMDEAYKRDSVVESYRNYYAKSKVNFARWSRGRPAPPWIMNSSGN